MYTELLKHLLFLARIMFREKGRLKNNGIRGFHIEFQSFEEFQWSRDRYSLQGKIEPQKCEFET